MPVFHNIYSFGHKRCGFVNFFSQTVSVFEKLK
ncbi:hypothetical protein KPNJ1_01079 [Klebsiella pneumoniae 30660/NJST258_1]|uniref:Uncharacterized protein n=1 Tax=Klebsiella pneumoniae 30684/NJST258_2 TaxID=1420013 RepID=W8UFR3_KLEPN|nr:hypothetical protein KPNJ2_01110 [Klebsiella pneumoniae 30684/NJST258_2]AHM83485.1 hypothetical protein KPNJ1_01079 [Klebsiella pneumoniae 30660/NJST258_1]